MLIGAALITAGLATGRATLADPSRLALLWLPEGGAVREPVPMVIAVQDQTGLDSRSWHYAEQLTAAGIAVLHFEPLDHSADGAGVPDTRDDATLAQDRMTRLVGSLAEDARFAGAPIGLLAFGGAGQAALRFAAGAGQNGHIAGLVLLYPGCEAMLPAEREQASDQRAPILLLHGDVDPANLPADCAALAERLARSAPVQRRQLDRAGYAWDRVPYQFQEAVALPWPGRPGAHVRAEFSQAAAERAAAQVEAFFTEVLSAEPR